MGTERKINVIREAYIILQKDKHYREQQSRVSGRRIFESVWEEGERQVNIEWSG